jgi:hypothetical protein
MATKIKDSATAERAALKLNEGIAPTAPSEPNTPRELTTSERLFPDFTTDDGAITNRPVRPREENQPIAPVAATPQAPAQGQTPPTQAPTVPTYLKPEELAGKMVKLKVDGIEQDVQASELIKLTQLERHSNAQLMKIAQERAQLERERQELLSRPPVPEPKPTKPEPTVKKSEEVQALEARLAQMEQSMVQERALLLPQIQEAGIKRVEQMAKDKTGFDDYRAYHDKVREAAVAEAAKAQAAGDMNAVRFFDSDNFYYQKYQELKLRDLASKTSVPPPTPTNPTSPVLQTQEGAPVVLNNSGKPVSIPTFEGSSGVPSTPSDNQNWQSTYNRLYADFKQNPSDATALALMRHKFKAEQ